MQSGAIRRALYAAGVLTMMVAMPSALAAGSAIAAPEIDGSSLTTGLGLLAAAMMIVRSHARR